MIKIIEKIDPIIKLYFELYYLFDILTKKVMVKSINNKIPSKSNGLKICSLLIPVFAWNKNI